MDVAPSHVCAPLILCTACCMFIWIVIKHMATATVQFVGIQALLPYFTALLRDFREAI